MLQVQNLTVTTVDSSTKILHNLTLDFEKSKITLIKGKNGSGKSTLAQIISGNPEYRTTQNSRIIFEGRNLCELKPNQISNLGIFVSHQYPTEIPGVILLDFLRLIIEINRKVRGLGKLTTKQTMDLIHNKLELIGWNIDFLKRGLNESMSGGERKKCEILQMLLLDPKLIILDEIDSGLDKDALEITVKIILNLAKLGKTLVIITHQQKIIDMIQPELIYELVEGKLKTV